MKQQTQQQQGEEFLTQQDDDADQDRDDGARPQAGRCHGAEGGAVSVFVAGTHLHFDDRPVGQRRVPRVRHHYGDLVHPRLQIHLVPQAQAGVVSCVGRGSVRVRGQGPGLWSTLENLSQITKTTA